MFGRFRGDLVSLTCRTDNRALRTTLLDRLVYGLRQLLCEPLSPSNV